MNDREQFLKLSEIKKDLLWCFYDDFDFEIARVKAPIELSLFEQDDLLEALLEVYAKMFRRKIYVKVVLI